MHGKSTVIFQVHLPLSGLFFLLMFGGVFCLFGVFCWAVMEARNGSKSLDDLIL